MSDLEDKLMFKITVFDEFIIMEFLKDQEFVAETASPIRFVEK